MAMFCKENNAKPNLDPRNANPYNFFSVKNRQAKRNNRGKNLKNFPPISARNIIAAQYFLYFGVLGFYLPYFNLYCYRIGLDGFQIGTLSSIRSITVIVFPLVWGRLADRYGTRKPIFVLCSSLCAFVWTFYLFTVDFEWMALVTLLYGIFYAPLVSFLEAFSLETLGPRRQGYGKIRAWGSLSFILMVSLTGELIEIYSASIILTLILAGTILQTLISLKMPSVKTSGARVRPSDSKSFPAASSALFLFCAFLMLASHGAYYGFFSIHLEKLGYDSSFIGICWAVAVSAEIVVMVKSETIFSRFSLEKVILFSIATAAARWLVLFMATSPALLLVSQAAHAITYGAFHMACVLYMDRLSPKNSKTLGQAVNNAVGYGLGLTVGFFVNGFLYERCETRYLFLFSALVAALAGFLALLPLAKAGKRRS